MTWDESTARLDAIKREFHAVHERYDHKNPAPEDAAKLRALRAECVDLHKLRIEMNMRRS